MWKLPQFTSYQLTLDSLVHQAKPNFPGLTHLGSKRKKKVGGKEVSYLEIQTILEEKKSLMGIGMIPVKHCLEACSPFSLPSFLLISWRQKLKTTASGGYKPNIGGKKTLLFQADTRPTGGKKGNFKPYVLSKCQL